MLLKIALCTIAFFQVTASDPIAEYREAAHKRWDADIRKLEALDQTETDPEHAVMFIGSSSIRLWDTIQEDLAPLPTIRRGYGGARFSDLAVFVERLVKPHRFDALAIFVGNDISGSENDKSPPEVLDLYKVVVAKVRKSHPEQPIFFIAVTPTPRRFDVWEEIRQANSLIEAYCETKPNLHSIATAEFFLDANGTPKAELFREDQLHLNRDGYRLWAKIIKSEIEKVLKPQAPQAP